MKSVLTLLVRSCRARRSTEECPILDALEEELTDDPS